MKLKVKATMDALEHEEGLAVMNEINKIAFQSSAHYGDSVVELVIDIQATDISDKVGVDGDGCRAFRGIEVVVIE